MQMLKFHHRDNIGLPPTVVRIAKHFLLSKTVIKFSGLFSISSNLYFLHVRRVMYVEHFIKTSNLSNIKKRPPKRVKMTTYATLNFKNATTSKQITIKLKKFIHFHSVGKLH